MQIIPFSSRKAPHNLTLSTEQFVPIPKWLPSTPPPFLVENVIKNEIEGIEGASKKKNPISLVCY